MSKKKFQGQYLSYLLELESYYRIHLLNEMSKHAQPCLDLKLMDKIRHQFPSSCFRQTYHPVDSIQTHSITELTQDIFLDTEDGRNELFRLYHLIGSQLPLFEETTKSLSINSNEYIEYVEQLIRKNCNLHSLLSNMVFKKEKRVPPVLPKYIPYVNLSSIQSIVEEHISDTANMEQYFKSNCLTSTTDSMPEIHKSKFRGTALKSIQTSHLPPQSQEQLKRQVLQQKLSKLNQKLLCDNKTLENEFEKLTQQFESLLETQRCLELELHQIHKRTSRANTPNFQSNLSNKISRFHDIYEKNKHELEELENINQNLKESLYSTDLTQVHGSSDSAEFEEDF